MKSTNKYKDKINIAYNESGHRTGFTYETENFIEKGLFDKKNRIDLLVKKDKKKCEESRKSFFYISDFEITPTNNIFANILEASIKDNFAIEKHSRNGKKLYFNISKKFLKQYKKINNGRK